MSVGKNLGPDHPPGIETRRVLRYCYNSTQLYEQMQNHTQSMTNVCSVLVSDKTCERVGLKWSDGIHYPDGVQCMGYHQFMDFFDLAAHINPGYRFSSSSRRRYQKLVTNVILANQLIAGGVFQDEDPVECGYRLYIILLCVSGCVIIGLVLIVFALRQTCHELEDQLERPRMVPMPMLTWAPSPLPALSAPPVHDFDIPIIYEEAEAATDDEGVDAVEDSEDTDGDVVADIPPAYSSLDLLGPGTTEAAEEMGVAIAIDESSVDETETGRPYPLMLPNHVGGDGPVAVCNTHAD